MRADELPIQSRFADTGLADHGDNLAVPAAGTLHRPFELIQFTGASDKPGETARNGGMQP